MDAADLMLFTLLALADVCLLLQLHRRRQRRYKRERMTRSLRSAIQREIGAGVVRVAPVRSVLLLSRAG